jgi:hypothetical protein
MLADNKHLAQWEELIDAVDKTNIPMHFINRIIIHFIDQSVDPKPVNVLEFRQNGFSNDEIEEILSEIIHESNSSVYAMDFFVDVENVAIEVQRETEKILHKL